MILKSSKIFDFLEIFKSVFRFRQLIGKPIDCTDEESIWQSLRTLHNMGPSHIIVSSISAAKLGGNQSALQMRASSKLESKNCFYKKMILDLNDLDNQYQTFQIDFPRLDSDFTGTGDSFSALILAWFHKTNNLMVSCHSLLGTYSIFVSFSVLVKKRFRFFIKFY
jgi:pyridoxal/pyridoxine/pyridoxamine kinase